MEKQNTDVTFRHSITQSVGHLLSDSLARCSPSSRRPQLSPSNCPSVLAFRGLGLRVSGFKGLGFRVVCVCVISRSLFPRWLRPEYRPKKAYLDLGS